MSKSELDIKTEILAAGERIRPQIRETPVARSAWLSGVAKWDAHFNSRGG